MSCGLKLCGGGRNRRCSVMSKPNSMVRSLPYPTIEDGNFSFPDGDYRAIAQQSGNSGTKIILRHELKGAPFVENLIQDGKARFACLVSVPKTGYRKLHMADSSEQEITWDLGVVGEPPMLGPVVLYVGDDLSHKLTPKDGVAKTWRNQKIDIPKGARLARGRYLGCSVAIQRLLKVRCKENMKPGSFTVSPNSNHGFYFCLEAAPDIFQFLQNPQGQLALRSSVLTHAVSQCFNILKSDYGASGEDDEKVGQWEQYKNLVSLSDWLETQKLPHWSEEDFDAVLMATHIYPIRISLSEEEE